MERPLLADRVEKLKNRATPKISQMSHAGDFSRCKALQNRYGRQRPLLPQLMWSLTSQRLRCISGPENFRSSAKKDFFNTIGAKRTLASADVT
jgi:hypothetical protein